MSGQTAQNRAQSEFEKGREEVFNFIGERLSFNSNRHAAEVMRDVFGVEQLMDDALDLNDAIQTSSQKLYGEIENMLHVLAAGENVYTLTGRDKIPTYKQITGGDINAGRLSAAEDFTIMLLSIDLTHITRPYAERYARKREEFIIPESVKTALGYSNGRVLEAIIQGVKADITDKLPQPALIGYEGAEPAPPRPPRLGQGLGGVFNAVARKATAGGIQGRFARVPKSWPPFVGAPDDQAVATQVLSAQSAVARITPSPDFKAVANDTVDFAAAQNAWLRKAYEALQSEHFEATRSSHDYAKRIGLPATWEKIVTDVAEDLFFDLRTQMAERMGNGAVGIGETAEDGVKSGQDWLAHELSKIDIPSRYPESRNKQVAAEHLAAFWMDTAKQQTPQPVAQKQPRKPAPRHG